MSSTDRPGYCWQESHPPPRVSRLLQRTFDPPRMKTWMRSSAWATGAGSEWVPPCRLIRVPHTVPGVVETDMGPPSPRGCHESVQMSRQFPCQAQRIPKEERMKGYDR